MDIGCAVAGGEPFQGRTMLEIAVVIIGSVVGAFLIHVAVNLQVKIQKKGD